MKRVERFNEFNSDKPSVVLCEKFGLKVSIEYNGGKDPTKDRFVMHLTGYDGMIGNEIEGEFDFKDHKDPEFEKYCKNIWGPITHSVGYWNVYDVFDFYKRQFKDMDKNSSLNSVEIMNNYIERSNKKIIPFGFRIVFENIK